MDLAAAIRGGGNMAIRCVTPLVLALAIGPALGIFAQEVRPEQPASSPGAPAAVSSIVSLLGHRPEALGAVYSPDGKWLITTGADKMVAIRDPLTGAIRRTLRGHTSRVYRAAVSPDSTIL